MRLPESIPRTTSLDYVSELQRFHAVQTHEAGLGSEGLGWGEEGPAAGPAKGAGVRVEGWERGVQGCEGLAAEAWEDGGWASVVRADWAADGGEVITWEDLQRSVS